MYSELLVRVGAGRTDLLIGAMTACVRPALRSEQGWFKVVCYRNCLHSPKELEDEHQVEEIVPRSGAQSALRCAVRTASRRRRRPG